MNVSKLQETKTFLLTINSLNTGGYNKALMNVLGYKVYKWMTNTISKEILNTPDCLGE